MAYAYWYAPWSPADWPVRTSTETQTHTLHRSTQRGLSHCLLYPWKYEKRWSVKFLYLQLGVDSERDGAWGRGVGAGRSHNNKLMSLRAVIWRNKWECKYALDSTAIKYEIFWMDGHHFGHGWMGWGEGQLQKGFLKKIFCDKYRGADKSLARPGRKQTTATEYFDVYISYL